MLSQVITPYAPHLIDLANLLGMPQGINMHLSLTERQEIIEEQLSKKHINTKVLDALTSDLDMMDKIIEGIEILELWCNAPGEYESQQARKDHIKEMGLKDIVETVYVTTLALKNTTTLANLIGILALKLEFEESYQGFKAAGEIIALLCYTDVYDLDKPKKYDSIIVKPQFALPDETKEYIENAQYLPPSICKPKYLMHNRSSGYRTIKRDSLILGGAIHHHNEDICLDVLNRMNETALELNQDMLSIQQEYEGDLDVIEDFEGSALEYQRAVSQQKENWELFLRRSDLAYSIVEDNPFYLTHKIDKRGRIYSQGYAINVQGNSYQKSLLDLYNKEIVEVPDDYFS